MASIVAGMTGKDDERSLLTGVVRVARGADGGVTALLPPDARRVADEVGAVMALLEGHADVTMDAVGRTVVPSVRQIRARFERRRSGSHGLAAVVLRRALGLDLKIAQYRDGARFVRRVRHAVGAEGLNAVWAGPENLPSPPEIADPREWVRRVHG
jgi:putative hydrolase